MQVQIMVGRQEYRSANNIIGSKANSLNLHNPFIRVFFILLFAPRSPSVKIFFLIDGRGAKSNSQNRPAGSGIGQNLIVLSDEVKISIFFKVS